MLIKFLDGTVREIANLSGDRYDPDPTVECSHGIHFFITEQEAKDYA